MTYIGILAYLQPAIGKKPRKMLLPISGKRAAKEDGKKADKRGTSRARKSVELGACDELTPGKLKGSTALE